MKKLAIVQSNYIPWKGYFDMIASVDEFVLYDSVQYTKNDWRNRNRIKTAQGLRWLTVPVKTGGRFGQTIAETQIDDAHWARAHWQVLLQNYRQAPCFRQIAPRLESFYCELSSQTHLSGLNRSMLGWCCAELGINTRLTDSTEYELIGDRSERLVEICAQANATEYVSGPAARDYLDVAQFERRGIKVTWFDYSGYQPYPQLWGEFEHAVSVLDLIFNCGQDAPRYLKHVNK
ncbi:WbqC-like protein family protein [Cupriavidus sp. YR651]|uniref:WbqC family protein n=1 Tax=Cupriavidus sp. YR651 TaxID=1855315 RepID=UPI0008868023|nr:WbqC family protein [Cupriavidus sp. YR651]SDC22359.1 WbqC-like protein family protein [Cupriavidus sp. YR651]